MKNYFVVGGSSGIGEALVQLLLKKGHRTFTTFCSPPVESANTELGYHYLDVREERLNLDFLPVQIGFNYHSQIATSKGAIEGLTRSLAAEFAPNIRVNAVAPSIVETLLAEKYLHTDDKKIANAERHPLKKIGLPQDIIEAATFLLSENSSWITGQIFHVDGGISNIKL